MMSSPTWSSSLPTSMSTSVSEAPLDGNKLDETPHSYRPLSRQRRHPWAHERESNSNRGSASRDRNSASENSSSSTRQNSGESTSRVSQTSSTSYTPSSTVPVHQFGPDNSSEYLYAASTTINGNSEYEYEKALPDLPSDKAITYGDEKLYSGNYNNRTSPYNPYKDDFGEEEGAIIFVHLFISY